MRLKKHLNNISYRVYSEEKNAVIPHAIIYQGEEGQMMLLTSVLIAVGVILLSSIALSLSNIGTLLPVEKSRSLLPEYENIRDKLGDYFDDLISENASDMKWITYVFNRAKEEIFFIESKHMRYFDATLDRITYLANGDVEIVVDLYLRDDVSSINEEVVYRVKV